MKRSLTNKAKSLSTKAMAHDEMGRVKVKLMLANNDHPRYAIICENVGQ
jgi:hypothetical protein